MKNIYEGLDMLDLTPRPARSTPTALDAYIKRTAEAAELLKRVSEYLDDMGEVAPDDVTWGNVGDMNRIIEKLSEIVAMCGGDVDHRLNYDPALYPLG